MEESMNELYQRKKIEMLGRIRAKMAAQGCDDGKLDCVDGMIARAEEARKDPDGDKKLEAAIEDARTLFSVKNGNYPTEFHQATTQDMLAKKY
jgi:hypothetical protein